MQIKQTGERPQRLRMRPPLGRDMVHAGGRSGRRDPAAVASPRNRRVVHTGARERTKGNYGQKEILKRALMPPAPRRFSLRRWNFRPTPSRLSTMSMA